MRKLLLVGCSALGLVAAVAQAQANSLYFTMPVNYDQLETDTIFVYGAAGVAGTITSPNGFSSPFTVGATDVTSVVIPDADDLVTSGAVTNNGFVISTNNSSQNVGASYLSRYTATTDTTYLFDASSLGTSYYAAGYQNDIGYPSQLSLVATQNNTTVTVTPSTGLASGQPAGVPFTVSLNAGQAVLYTDSGGGDITGTKITSSSPIAVFGGNQCVDIPAGNTACDHILTALPSTDNYTKNAVIITTVGTETPASNIVRVLAATNGTQVTYNGTTVATLNAGQYADFRSDAGGVIAANNPILINEYLTGQSEHSGTVGDPAQSWIPGTDQWLKNYVFSTPVGNQSYVTNFLDVALLAGDVGSLDLDGLSVPGSDCTAIGTSGYDDCNISIVPGSGEISDADPFLLLLDGGTQYDSYFTFAGATFSPGASPPPPPPPSTGVPEPLTLSIFGAGLAGAAAIRRRRKTLKA